jgi:uncharacterized protein (DUF433 family)
MIRLDRIVSDPEICHGQPVIRGLRYPVEFIVDLLASGMSAADVLADYADLGIDDSYAAIEYSARASSVKRVVRLGAAFSHPRGINSTEALTGCQPLAPGEVAGCRRPTGAGHERSLYPPIKPSMAFTELGRHHL